MSQISIRQFLPNDLEPLAELMNTINQADGLEMAVTASEVGEWLASPHTDPSNDYRVAVVGGDLVGYASVSHRPSTADFARSIIKASVLPQYRSEGLSAELFAWAQERGTEKMVVAGQDLPQQLWAFGRATELERLTMHEDAGFEVLRYYHDMIRPLAENEPVSVPSGIVIVPWSTELDEGAFATEVAAFNDHWGSIPMDAATWKRFTNSEATRLDLSYLALSEGEVVGISMNAHYPHDSELSGRIEGWIDSLGVVREWRKKGVATALMQRSFAAFTKEGFTHAILGVDTENPTGAASLYTGAGFEAIRTEVLHVKHLNA